MLEEVILDTDSYGEWCQGFSFTCQVFRGEKVQISTQQFKQEWEFYIYNINYCFYHRKAFHFSLEMHCKSGMNCQWLRMKLCIINRIYTDEDYLFAISFILKLTSWLSLLKTASWVLTLESFNKFFFAFFFFLTVLDVCGM